MTIEKAYRVGLLTQEEYDRWLAVCRIEKVLGRSVAPCDYRILFNQWHCFCVQPEKYAGTAMVDCVNQWLDELVNSRWGINDVCMMWPKGDCNG